MSIPTYLSRIAVTSAVALACVSAQGALVSVSGAGAIIAAPSQVTNAAVTNSQQEGFNEQQGVLLGSSLGVDGGTISAGTVVSSHMIFLNIPTTLNSASAIATWAFDGVILGVMSDQDGLLEAASNALLGATGTTYPGSFSLRGIEIGSGDGYTISGNSLVVNMNVAQPGDWIRVVTATADIPEPGSLALAALALAGLGLVHRRRG